MSNNQETVRVFRGLCAELDRALTSGATTEECLRAVEAARETLCLRREREDQGRDGVPR